MTKDEAEQLRHIISVCLDLEDMSDGLFSAASETFYNRDFLQTMQRKAKELVELINSRVGALDSKK